MRVTKPRERWFNVPDDPDGARIKIRALTPGERQDIIDRAFVQEIEYKENSDGNMIPIMKQHTDTKYDREATLKKCVVGWEGLFDEDGSIFEFSVDNILRAAREIPGFGTFVNHCRKRIDKDFVEDEKDLEKN